MTQIKHITSMPQAILLQAQFLLLSNGTTPATPQFTRSLATEFKKFIKRDKADYEVI